MYAGEARAELVRAASPLPCVCVKSRAEFVGKLDGATVAFVDLDLLRQLDGGKLDVPIIAILDDVTSALAATVDALGDFGWLAHTITTALLRNPMARAHVTLLVEQLSGSDQVDTSTSGIGRVARLARASRREARFERMQEFFTTHGGLSARALTSVNEVAEELVMNALYDAPFEAGYFKAAVPRTEDVSLPPDQACEISYGIEGDVAFVRVRDMFGAMTRERLVHVLTRCNGTTVPLDESRGGAGLGLWRVFTNASSISITVLPGELTDILVRFVVKDGRMVKRLLAMHLVFAPKVVDTLDGVFLDDTSNMFDQSITLLLA